LSEASGAEQNPPPCGRGAGTTVQGRNAYTGRAAVARFAIAIAVTHSISCPESLSQKVNVPRSAFTTPAMLGFRASTARHQRASQDGLYPLTVMKPARALGEKSLPLGLGAVGRTL